MARTTATCSRRASRDGWPRAVLNARTATPDAATACTKASGASRRAATYMSQPANGTIRPGRRQPARPEARLVHYLQEGRRTAVAGLVDGAQAELHVVLGDVQRDRGDVADADRAGPVRRGGLAHHHLVPGQVGFGIGVPVEGGEVGAGQAGRWR